MINDILLYQLNNLIFFKIQNPLFERGYAFVELGDARDADDAVYDLNGRSMMGMRYAN